MLLAHAFHSTVFGDRSFEDIVTSDLIDFKCDDARNREPVLKARASRASFSDRPMNDEAARGVLADLMRKAGMATGKRKLELSVPGLTPANSCTFYATRRGFATSTGINLDPRHAKFLMGHAANSTMFERYCDQSHDYLNMTEGILGPEEAREMVVNPISFRR